jgi:hypothetical protein
MREPRELDAARAHLARAESLFGTSDGVVHLQEGLALLEDLVEGAGPHAAVARNVGRAYCTTIYRRISSRVSSGAPISEPDLERLFETMRSFDDVGLELPDDARALKVEVVKRLLALYTEGRGAAEKQRIFARLGELLGGQGET